MSSNRLDVVPHAKDFLFGVFSVLIGLILGVLLLIASIFFIPFWDDFTNNGKRK
jgi:hypothetical protein